MVCCELISRQGSWLSGRWLGWSLCWLFFSFFLALVFCSEIRTTIFAHHWITLVVPVIHCSLLQKLVKECHYLCRWRQVRAVRCVEEVYDDDDSLIVCDPTRS